MSTGTALHPRTEILCNSRAWRQWSGFSVASTYNDFAQPEYAAIRHAAALIDVSPLFKYLVSGPDAERLTNRVFTQDTAKMDVGQIVYTPWCDTDGSVRQEGTVFRMSDNSYQVCSVEPSMGWMLRNAVGLDVTISDHTTDTAVLALQGPTSRDVLVNVVDGPVADLKFFQWMDTSIGGVPVMISRTGYTGDLGYEVWIPAADAVTVWDALMEGGRPHNITPCGLEAMDIARVEAGFVLLNVDYVSSESALLPHHRMSPYELGFGWAVKLKKDSNFVGRQALLQEHQNNTSTKKLIGLEIGWPELEELYLSAGVMPDLPLVPCREPVPIYNRAGDYIGRATTRVWSTMLKKYLALATVDAKYAAPGTSLLLEQTVDFQRNSVVARVAKTPFFRPERMRA
jgi:aminomethyltransferase